MFEEVRNVFIVFTRNCNLRCEYCYESKNKNSISIEVLNKIIEFIKENKKINIISLFGGETFLELDKIDYFINKLIKLKNETGRNFTINSNTNGTIYNEKLVRLLNKISDNFEFYYIVSIDGNKKFHNSKRRYINGNNTYDDIIKNIKLLKKESPKTFIDFHCVIQLEMCKDFYSVAKDIVRNPLFTTGAFEFLMKTDNKIHYTINDFENVFKAIMKLNKEGYSKHFLLERFDNILKSVDYRYNNFVLKKGYCLNGKEAITVDCDGLVYPCDYYLALEPEKQKKYFIYNFINGDIKDNFERLKKLTTETKEQINKCDSCNIQHSCYICTAVKDVSGELGFQLECLQNKMILQAMNNVKFQIF